MNLSRLLPARPLLAGALLCLAAATASAQDAGAVDAMQALQRAAAAMYPTSAAPAGLPTLEKVREVDMYDQGLRYETYDAADGAGKQLGRLVRMQIWSKSGAVMDVALGVDQTRITTAVAVRPLKLGGKEFKAMPALIDSVRARPVDSWALEMELLFGAIALLPSAEKAVPSTAAVEPATSSTVVFSATQPDLEVGAPIPLVEAATADGKRFASSSMLGKPTVVLLVNAADRLGWDMLNAVSAVLERLPDVAFRLVLSGPPAKIRWMRSELPARAKLIDTAVLDPDEKVKKAFKAPWTPFLFLFDRSGRLAYKSFWAGRAALARDIPQNLGER